MNRWTFIAIFTLITALIGVACGSGNTIVKPPEIRYGEDVCDQCRMIITDEGFAAAYVTKSGDARKFDDIDDMLAYFATHREDVAGFFVHDFETHEWLPARDAAYVEAPDIHSPMGHHVVAFKSQETAQAFAQRAQGKIWGFDQLLASTSHANDGHK